MSGQSRNKTHVFPHEIRRLQYRNVSELYPLFGKIRQIVWVGEAPDERVGCEGSRSRSGNPAVEPYSPKAIYETAVG